MHIVVCVRRLANGELNPFDACAYEAALRLFAQVTLLSMGPPSVGDFLLGLTRLGARRAVLLTDPAFAGADTLATSYTLSLALRRLDADLILCGRQTIDGDTGQVGAELSTLLDIPYIPYVMQLTRREDALYSTTRDGQSIAVPTPALLTLERSCTLRLPSIRSKLGTLDIWDAAALGADLTRCGQTGSPTKVLTSFKNEQDRRRCRRIPASELMNELQAALQKPRISIPPVTVGARLSRVLIIGEAPRAMAQTVSDDITSLPLTDAHTLTEQIQRLQPTAVLWGSDPQSKTVSAQVAARLQTGLCADCTRLETDGEQLFMYRPAFAGDIIAKITCRTQPQMATVRTQDAKRRRITVGVGYGVKDDLDKVRRLAQRLDADIVCSRKTVDHDCMPYEAQVGLTGRSISPDVYLAIGISGAVHHIAGIRGAGTIIAINPDTDAPIFDYADIGIVGTIDDVL